ncbi:YcgJ family protein [Enterobacter hormaechei]|uniref:YcgJ family protein n=1 Tax=Enterobacter hormaechei TaxID=158836 RepID=UPI0032DB0D98
MKRKLMLLFLSLLPVMAGAMVIPALTSPAKGVVCDIYFCADAGGISQALTDKWLGPETGARLRGQGEFDHRSFTFANGVHCDAGERVCRSSRYFGPDGRPSGTVDDASTQLLFGANP